MLVLEQETAKLIDNTYMTLEAVANKYQNTVRKLAFKYKNGAAAYGLDVNDLIGAGNEGLIKAYHKYDNSREIKFMTIVYKFIEGYILNHIRNYGMTVRFSREEREFATFLRKNNITETNVEKLMNTYGKRKMIVITALLLLEKNCFSLDSKINDQDDSSLTMHDTLGVCDIYFKNSFTINFNKFVNNLSERDKKIVILRSQGKSQREIGEIFGITQCRVSCHLKRIHNLYKEYENKL